MTITAQDFLMGGGSKSAKFNTIGASVSGYIVREPEVKQQTEFGTGRPLTWDDGKPRLQLVVQIQTDERDPQDPEDDGIRSIYVKGKSLTNAVREAVRKAGAQGLEVGGWLTVTYVADGKADRGMPPKLYTASYRRPADEFFAGQDAPAAAPVSPAPTGQPVANVAPAGVDQAIWDQMSPEQRTKLLAAMNR